MAANLAGSGWLFNLQFMRVELPLPSCIQRNCQRRKIVVCHAYEVSGLQYLLGVWSTLPKKSGSDAEARSVGDSLLAF
jgi:hypothetical protein